MIKQIARLSLLLLYTGITAATPDLKSSTDFLSASVAEEFVRLSDAVYYLRSCKNRHIPANVTCHSYTHKKDGSQVMVVSSDEKKYVAIVFAGSDDLKNWETDFDLSWSTFGPSDNPIADVKVHKGFNEAVFNEGLFDELQSTARGILDQKPGYRFFISGHSLGGADSILAGAAMAHFDPHLNITVINYGCPRTGDEDWKNWANSLPNLGVWRLVYRDDIVPRMPNAMRFYHVGHTVQMDKRGTKVYYLHSGDKKLGYKGVPWDWESGSLSSPTAAFHHPINNYVKWIRKKVVKYPGKYFPGDFVKRKEVDADADAELSAVF